MGVPAGSRGPLFRSVSAHRSVSALAGLALAAACAPVQVSWLDMTTWSIVAMDPVTGDVGVSMASCVPETYGDAVAALAPGRGAAAVQARWDLTNRNRVFELLKDGLPAGEIVRRVTAPEADSVLGRRQYGIVTMAGGSVELAGFTGDQASTWSGRSYDRRRAVTAQGNTLVGEAVVGKALEAFLQDDPAGLNTLPDRLMRALEAGSAAGGDIRCNRDGITSTAATAMILVARGGDEPYATADIGMTDQGTPAAPWLALSETNVREGPNPIIELRRRYDAWRRVAAR